MINDTSNEQTEVLKFWLVSICYANDLQDEDSAYTVYWYAYTV